MKLPALGILAALVLGACQRDAAEHASPKPAPARHTPAAVAKSPAPKDSTAGMIEAASQGKSQAPVTVKFGLDDRPVVGRPVTIALAVLPHVPAAPVVVEISGSPGVDLDGSDQRLEFPTVDAEHVYRRQISVTPSLEGVLLVNLSVSIKHDEVTDTRSFAVPLIVAAAAAPVPPPPAAPGTGSAPASAMPGRAENGGGGAAAGPGAVAAAGVAAAGAVAAAPVH